MSRKGADWERAIVKKYKKAGWIAFRSAASKASNDDSGIDVIAIDPLNFQIDLINCKTGHSYTENALLKFYMKGKHLDGQYKVTFKVEHTKEPYSEKMQHDDTDENPN